MTPTSRIRKFVFASVPFFLFAGALALAVTASGCVIDSGPGSGYGSCLPDLWVDWQIQNAAGAPVTCAGAGAATVTATVNGTPFPQTCLADESFDSIDVPLAGTGSYSITVDLFDDKGNPLATPQTYAPPLQINNCYSNETPSPAILVVSPPAP